MAASQHPLRPTNGCPPHVLDHGCVNFKIKGKDIQSGLVQWEQLILSLEQDHEEKLSPKLRRAFLMNVLPSWMQGKVMEHLDRLKTYAEVRGKVVSLCHTCSGDVPDCNQLENPEWQNEYEEEWNEEEPGLQALNGTCHNCGGTGHFARDCPSPVKPRSTGVLPNGAGKGGRGGKADRGKADGGKARGKGGRGER